MRDAAFINGANRFYNFFCGQIVIDGARSGGVTAQAHIKGKVNAIFACMRFCVHMPYCVVLPNYAMLRKPQSTDAAAAAIQKLDNCTLVLEQQ